MEKFSFVIFILTVLITLSACSEGPATLFKNELKKKYEHLAQQLSSEIQTQTEKGGRQRGSPLISLTSIQQTRVEIGKFQRQLLLKLHKEGHFTSAAIKQVERTMDIDELQSASKL